MRILGGNELLESSDGTAAFQVWSRIDRWRPEDGLPHRLQDHSEQEREHRYRTFGQPELPRVVYLAAGKTLIAVDRSTGRSRILPRQIRARI